MKCEKAQELFSEYYEGTLERPMAVALERHIAECLECEREYTTFSTTWEMLSSLPAVEPPPGFATQVVMAVQLQQETARRSRPRWQTIWDNLFTTRMPVKVFAGAVAATVICAQVVMHTPIKGAVSAWIIGTPATSVTSNSHVRPMQWQSNGPAEAWMNSGLSFNLAGSRDVDGRSIFRLLLKPENVTNKHIKVYLVSSDSQSFDTKSLGKANIIFDDEINGAGRVIPFVFGQSAGRQDVMTAIVEWEHRQRQFREAVFVPIQIGDARKPVTNGIKLDDTDLYSALQEVSGKFGVVILAQADINAKIDKVSVKDGKAEDAIYQIARSAGLGWRPIGNQVYIIERRLE